MKKLTLIIYTAVIAATGLSALIFKEYLNIVIDSLIPLGVTVAQICIGLLIKNNIIYLRGGDLYRVKSSDFKYSKNDRGEGEFNVVNSHRRGPGKKAQTILGYAFILAGALSIPIIFFFPITVKWYSLGLILVPMILGSVAAIPADLKETKAAIEEQRALEEQWQKELEEQKKREEMGKWK